MGYRFVPECNHTRAYMKVIHVKLLLFFFMSDLQDHDSLRSSNFDAILDYKAVGLFHNIGFARQKAPTVVIFSREARGLHRPVGRPSS